MKKHTEKSLEQNMQHTALVMAVNCVRNTIIENYHAAGKLNDTEMMAFNKEVANKLYTFLTFLFGSDLEKRKRFFQIMDLMYPHNWDQPQLDKEMIDSVNKDYEANS